jgi:replicative superfamily II helicase
LPDGDQLSDFAGWLRRDKEGDPIKSSWRPTDLRFGEIVWQANVGRINFTIGEARPFIPGYIMPTVLSNPGRRKKTFPKDAQELTLAATWRLVEDNHTVLIYCPQKRSVNSFASIIIDLHLRGALESVLDVLDERIELAKALGREWLGAEHPIVKCLDIGVAIHHGTLPSPFRKEMEKLLREGVLKITVSSPTLAQGLNLAATTVIVYSLYRSGTLIDASEFRNVAGRAGRAFIDTHGLVLHPIFDRHNYRVRQWRELVEDASARNMESGLVQLVRSLLKKMANSLASRKIQDISDYVLNNARVWDYPVVPTESTEQSEDNQKSWSKNIQMLDTALLSLLGTEDISISEIPDALDAILQSSLWRSW